MSFAFNLHRFGVDEFAIGHLINGDFPEDDEERWRIIKAPEWHIRRMFGEHRRAQEALAGCARNNKTFALYLRSFSVEHSGAREGVQVIGSISFSSLNFQSSLTQYLNHAQIPLIRLHGGSDGFDSGDDACVLSTHSCNWEGVAKELINNAGAIIFLISDLSAGLKAEIDIIRALDRTERCLVAIAQEKVRVDEEIAKIMGIPIASKTPQEDVRDYIPDFPHVFDLEEIAGETSLPAEVTETLSDLLQNSVTNSDLPKSLSARFTYIERSFIESDEFIQTEARIWQMMRELRVFLDDAYWTALKKHSISFRHLMFENAWKGAHQIYGLAIAASDFYAIDEILQHLFKFYMHRNADFALLIPDLSEQYKDLAHRIFNGPPINTEASFGVGPNLMSLPRTIEVALRLHEQALARQETDPKYANLIHFAALNYALGAEVNSDVESRWIAAHIAEDWSAFQFRIDLGQWGITHSELSTAILRRLAEENEDKYTPDLARSLNNLGKRHWDLDHKNSAEEAFREAVIIRSRIGPVTPMDTVNLYNSLASLGWLLGQTDRAAEARKYFDEALTHCRRHTENHADGAADLVRLLGRKADALAPVPEFARESAETIGEANQILAEAITLDDDMKVALTALIASVGKKVGSRD